MRFLQLLALGWFVLIVLIAVTGSGGMFLLWLTH